MEYAQKVCLHAVRFEAWKGDQLVGLVAVYMNDEGKEKAFVTNVSVVHEYVGRGIASLLIEQAMLEAKQQKLKKIILEVSANNPAAVSLYRKMNFVVDKQDESSTLTMSKYL